MSNTASKSTEATQAQCYFAEMISHFERLAMSAPDARSKAQYAASAAYYRQSKAEAEKMSAYLIECDECDLAATQ
jgi:hypothetical protein